jgi:hypothetical protein
MASSAFSAPLAYGVRGSRLYLGVPPHFQFDVIAADGSVEGILRASHLDLTVTEAARDGYRTQQRESQAGQRDPAGMERALQGVEFPATRPPFSQALVDGLDHLWVRHYRLPGAVGPEAWSVFHPEGHLLGLVEMPERLQVRQIGGDFVLGIWTDELDVRHIRLYSLERD